MSEKVEGILDSDFDYIDEIQKVVCSMLENRSQYISNKRETNKNKYENSQELTKLKEMENLNLRKDYTVILSDVHGDFFSLYGTFVQCGYLVPNEDPNMYRFIAYESGPNDQIERSDMIGNKNCLKLFDEKKKVVILPNFSVNKKFKARIEMLGDIIDRGPESLRCIALLDYLTNFEAEQLVEKYDEQKLLYVHCGNHEANLVPDSLYAEKELIYKIINNMKSNGRMVYSSIIKEDGGKYISFSHTSFCKSHIYKIIGIMAKFYNMIEKNPESEVLKTIKTNFVNTKTKIKYKTLFELLDKKLEELKTKLKNIPVSLTNTLGNAKKNFTPKELDILSDEFQKLNTLAAQINSVDTKFAKLSPLSKIVKKIGDNKKEAYNLLKETLNLQDYDYYLLRDFIVEVIPPDYYIENAQAINDFFENGGFFKSKDRFFTCLENADCPYWPLNSRYTPTLEETFESIIQFVGHDPNQRIYPYIKSRTVDRQDEKLNMVKHGRIICVDSLLSIGFRECPCKGNQSDSILLIRTPDGKYILEKFSVSRNNKLEILPKTLEMKEAYIGVGQDSTLAVMKESNPELKKRFYSFKRLIEAFYNIKLKNKDKKLAIESNKKEMEIDSQEIENGEIEKTEEEKKIERDNMDPKKTLEYFETEIKRLTNGDDKRKLSSNEIDIILKDFDRKTDLESLSYFLERCQKFNLSGENFHKLMKHYDDVTNSDLIMSITVSLENNGKLKKNTIRPINRSDIKKLFGRLEGKVDTLCIHFTLVHIEEDAIEPLFTEYMNDILGKLGKIEKTEIKYITFSSLYNDIFHFVPRSLNRFLNWPNSLDDDMINNYDDIDFDHSSKGRYIDLTFSHLYKICFSFKVKTMSEGVIPYLLNEIKATFKMYVAKKGLSITDKRKAWCCDDETIDIIVKTFKESAQKELTEKLYELKDKVDRAFFPKEPYSRDHKHNNNKAGGNNYKNYNSRNKYEDRQNKDRHDENYNNYNDDFEDNKEDSPKKIRYDRSRDRDRRNDDYDSEDDRKYSTEKKGYFRKHDKERRKGNGNNYERRSRGDDEHPRFDQKEDRDYSNDCEQHH